MQTQWGKLVEHSVCFHLASVTDTVRSVTNVQWEGKFMLTVTLSIASQGHKTISNSSIASAISFRIHTLKKTS